MPNEPAKPTREDVLERVAKREYFWVSQLADVLGVHRCTVSRWIRERKLKVDKRGPRKTIIWRDQVFAFLEEMKA